MQNILNLFSHWMLGFYPALFVLIVSLYYFNPASRKRMGAAALLALCSLAGLLVAGALGAEEGGGRFLKLGLILSRLLAAISAVNVAGALSFSLLLPKLGVRIPKLLEDLILAGAYVAAGLAVISASGANLSGIMATSAVVTAVVAFSLQDTLGNVIGGMVLHLENSFVPGDRIKIEDNEGIVREIRWRQTTLETPAGDLIIIPNIILMKSSVTVLGRAGGNRRFRTVVFNVYYDRAPGEIISAVARVLRDDPPEFVASEPPPDCVIKEFQGSCIVYEARYWLTDLSMGGMTDSKVRSRIYYALSREGIKLSIPSRSVVITEDAREVVEKSRKEEWDRRLGALRGVPVFGALTEGERDILADKLKSTPFSKDEVITRQGAVADWLYIIYEGGVDVRVHSGRSDSYRVVKTLGPGDFLGEMGLFTGEPRSATAVARTDVRCYRLDREGFGGVLASRPEIAKSIALLLAKRRVELEEAKGALAGENAGSDLKTEQQNLFSKIKTFFNL
jgi:small-conductance mechanosensitive channel/CRP-like cAMP-binding protein